MILICCIIAASGVFMAQLLIGFIEDDDSPIEERLWAYGRFGGSSRAIYSMFEATFTGSWHLSARPMIADVSSGFGVFWVLYVICINFAMMRIVAALFLKQTLAVATQDSEHMAVAKLERKRQVAELMRELFTKADKTGDGLI